MPQTERHTVAGFASVCGTTYGRINMANPYKRNQLPTSAIELKAREERVQTIKQSVRDTEQLLKDSHDDLLDPTSCASWLRDARAGLPTWTNDNAELLIARIKHYFNLCQEGDVKATTAGLTMAAGYSKESSIYNLADNDSVPVASGVIQKALLHIKMIHEQGLHKPACTGHIFALKAGREPWIDTPVRETSINLPIVVITGLPSATCDTTDLSAIIAPAMPTQARITNEGELSD